MIMGHPISPVNIGLRELRRETPACKKALMQHLAHQDELILDVISRIEALPKEQKEATSPSRLDVLIDRLEQND